ncbi:MAG: DUF3160 domain-containing protein [Patescibacteria group bacterium]
MNKKNSLIAFIIPMIVVVALSVYFIFPETFSKLFQKTQELTKEVVNNVYSPEVVLDSKFAEYKEVPVNFNPQVPSYSVRSDLSNVENIDNFYFSEAEKKLLLQNAFVVRLSSHNNEFFPIYESNRYSYIPSFITTDSILHNYHLMFSFLLKQLEEERLIGVLKELNADMLNKSLVQYESLKGSSWENSAKRNVAFFAVGSKLLDSSIVIPTMVKDEVEKELSLIDAHNGIDLSAVMNIGNDEAEIIIETPQGPQNVSALKEDYSQYIPRGHYDKSEELRAYFKSMMWYGRLTFRIKSEDETRSAILITLALNEKNNENNWNKIYEPINFFVGKSDDITYYQFKDLVEDVYGENSDYSSLIEDDNKLASFINLSKELEAPQINSMPIFEASINSDRDEEIKGFRFMGQRFTIDAAIFQRLIYREVGDKTKTCENFESKETGCLLGARCLPAGLDIPATLGSTEAKNILKEMGEGDYACYNENMSQMNNYLNGLESETWTQNLYWGWLYQLRPLLTQKKEGYPVFMQNTAWARKDLNTFLGSWSQLKHDTILYAKQVYAELGGGMPEEKDDRGYVEPNPYVYARLASLLQMTEEGLEIRGLLSPSMKDNLNRMQELAISLKIISEKELNNEKLNNEEYELIRSYGGQLEHLWLEVHKNEKEFQSMGQRDFLNENPAAIIADVATDPNGAVLEVGTGKISEIYVVVPIDGKLRIAKGGVYSYYEFSWPMSDRLTDKKWRELLMSDEAPKTPYWTKAFIAE